MAETKIDLLLMAAKSEFPCSIITERFFVGHFWGTIYKFSISYENVLISTGSKDTNRKIRTTYFIHILLQIVPTAHTKC